MKVAIKDGVVFKEFNIYLLNMIKVASDVGDLLKTQMTITSGVDGKHADDSLHYKSLALDFRTRNLTPDQEERAIAELKSRLGGQYQVIKEVDHIHVQHHPH
jgi:hypothetical protein